MIHLFVNGEVACPDSRPGEGAVSLSMWREVSCDSCISSPPYRNEVNIERIEFEERRTDRATVAGQ